MVFPADDTGPEVAGRGRQGGGGRAEDHPAGLDTGLESKPWLLGHGAVTTARSRRGGHPGTVTPRLNSRGAPGPACFSVSSPPSPRASLSWTIQDV